jgi:uncharacterized protein (TIGR04255 family)
MPYARPPITEAVIGVRFEPSLDSGMLDRLIQLFRKDYPNQEDRVTITVKAGLDDTAVHKEPGGAKLTKGDGSSCVIINVNEFSTVFFAPYPGWSEL